jgi:hypothetical protein
VRRDTRVKVFAWFGEGARNHPAQLVDDKATAIRLYAGCSSPKGSTPSFRAARTSGLTTGAVVHSTVTYRKRNRVERPHQSTETVPPCRNTKHATHYLAILTSRHAARALSGD